MLGFDAISESPISAVPTVLPSAASAVGASTMHGVTVVAGAMTAFAVANMIGTTDHSGIKHTSMGAVGASSMQARAFVGLGDTLSPVRNQLFNFSVDILQSLLWSNDTSAAFISLMQAKQEWVNKNQEQFWEDWFTNVFDLRTADDFGCAVWSLILQIPLNIQYGQTDGANFGFDPYQQNFDRSNFAPLNYEVIPLSLDQKRLVLQLRYYQLITRGVPSDINRNFARIFASFGKAYVVDNLNMTMTYIFDFDIPSALAFILRFYNLLPAPTGVKVNFSPNGRAAATMVGVSSLTGAVPHAAGHITGAATMLAKSGP